MRMGLDLGLGRRRGVGRRETLLDVDFTALSLGDMSSAALEAASGFRFARASDGHTVQTSASTVAVVTAGNDRVRVGQRAGSGTRGVVVEEARTNHVWDSRDMGAAQWTPGVQPPTVNYAAGPDGQVRACRTQTAASGYSNYHNSLSFPGLVGAAVVSSWFRGTSGSCVLQSYGPNAYWSSSLTTTWGRYWNQANISQWNPADFSGGPLVGQGAIDFLADLQQMEGGRFPTEVIITTVAPVTRAGERLWLPDAASVTDEQRIGMELTFIPKGTDDKYDADMAAWYSNSDHRVMLNCVSKQVTVTIGGVGYTTTTPLSFAYGDVVDLWVEAGGGTLNTVVKSRVNGGAAVTHGTSGAPQTTIGLDGWPMNVASNTSAAAQLTSWVQGVAFYKSDRRPDWAA